LLSCRAQPSRCHRCSHPELLLPPCATRREGEGGQPRPLGPPVAPPTPTSCHQTRPSHQPPSDPKGRRGKREPPRPNGLPHCPHTLHPPHHLRHPATTERDRRADQLLQPEGEIEKGGAAEAKRGASKLPSHLSCHLHHPICSRRPECAQTPIVAKSSRSVALLPDPGSLHRPPTGSGLLTLSGVASPPYR
jgi:hypothetical protein